MTDDTRNNGQTGADKPKLNLVKGSPSRKGKTAPKSDFEALQHIQEADGEKLQSFYQVIQSGLSAGVWFHEAATAKDGTEYMKAPMKLSDPFEIVGRGQGMDDKEYRLLRYKRTGCRESKAVALPLEIVGGREGWAFLRGLGIGVNQNGTTMAHLANYLQWEGSQTEYLFSKRGGWVDDACTAYIMPDGDIIGTPEKPVFYVGDLSKRRAYASAGSLEEWQAQLARYAVGNSRLLLALGAVFASPLLGIMKQENGGFHFFGSSSIGKSIIGRAALSVIGNPDELKVQWNGTGLSFDNTAAANNDGIVFLDEMGQADGKTLDYAAYAVFNGAKKGQGAKEGGNREHVTWRVLAVSNGEYEPAYFMKKYGLEWQAGQAVRLPAIPADAGKGFGAFEELHEFTLPEMLAVQLEDAAKAYHGTAWRQYLACLTKRMQENPKGLIGRLNALQADFMAALPSDLASQPRRAGKRFALAAAALELAGEFGITGIERGAGLAGVKTCFNAWLEREGTANREEVEILRNARDFLLEFGWSERFVSEPRKSSIETLADKYEAKRSHAGFRVEVSHGTDKPRFFVLDKPFEEEICKGKDKRLVCKILSEKGWLAVDGRNYKIKLPKGLTGENLMPKGARMYCFNGTLPPDEGNENGDGA